MADVTENTLRAAIKALTDVVAPSVDPTDALANEQLRLVVDYLEFVHNRLDFLYERDRFELRHHLAMARSLMDLGPTCSAAAAAAMQAAVGAGVGTYALSGASMPDLKAASAVLAAAIRVLVREAPAFDEAMRCKVERCVLDMSDHRLTFDRSWYMPLGFDPAPGEVPMLSVILARAGR